MRGSRQSPTGFQTQPRCRRAVPAAAECAHASPFDNLFAASSPAYCVFIMSHKVTLTLPPDLVERLGQLATAQGQARLLALLHGGCIPAAAHLLVARPGLLVKLELGLNHQRSLRPTLQTADLLWSGPQHPPPYPCLSSCPPSRAAACGGCDHGRAAAIAVRPGRTRQAQQQPASAGWACGSAPHLSGAPEQAAFCLGRMGRWHA